MKRGQRKAKAKQSPSRVSRQEIGELQKMLAKSVLTGQPLPGGTHDVSFPDISFIQRQPAVVFEDVNIAGTMSLDGLSKPVRVVSPEAIQVEAQSQGDVTYLHFQPAAISGNEVTLTLQARIASREPEQRMAGLSNIQVKFRRRGGKWEVVREPVYSAS